MAQAMLEVLQTDRTMGQEVLHGFRLWLANMECPNTNAIGTVDEYLKFRVHNIGAEYVSLAVLKVVKSGQEANGYRAPRAGLIGSGFGLEWISNYQQTK